MTGTSCWVVVPVAQQGDGTWIDGVLQERLRESPLFGKEAISESAVRGRVEVIRADDPEGEVNERFYRRGWTDGLPIVAPTLSRVREMLRLGPPWRHQGPFKLPASFSVCGTGCSHPRSTGKPLTPTAR